MVTNTTMTVLEIFHHSIARRIAGKKAMKEDGGEWEWAQ